MAEYLVFNPMTSASASLMRIDISTNTPLIICKHILKIRHLCTMTVTNKRKSSVTTSDMAKVKSTNEPSEQEQEAGGDGDSGVDSDTG